MWICIIDVMMTGNNIRSKRKQLISQRADVTKARNGVRTCVTQCRVADGQLWLGAPGLPLLGQVRRGRPVRRLARRAPRGGTARPSKARPGGALGRARAAAGRRRRARRADDTRRGADSASADSGDGRGGGAARARARRRVRRRQPRGPWRGTTSLIVADLASFARNHDSPAHTLRRRCLRTAPHPHLVTSRLSRTTMRA